jgi:hypothetical protein
LTRFRQGGFDPCRFQEADQGRLILTHCVCQSGRSGRLPAAFQFQNRLLAGIPASQSTGQDK